MVRLNRICYQYQCKRLRQLFVSKGNEHLRKAISDFQGFKSLVHCGRAEFIGRRPDTTGFRFVQNGKFGVQDLLCQI